jgi:hypothetical protein
MGRIFMANFYQQNQQIHGTQVNADVADLRGAFLPGGADVHELLRDLRTIADGLRAAQERGLLDRTAAGAAEVEVRAAIQELGSGEARTAGARVERAVKVLQAAAPIAAIAGTLTSVWHSLAGGA